jgi:quercetin dioxygenase-like cupin family protein
VAATDSRRTVVTFALGDRRRGLNMIEQASVNQAATRLTYPQICVDSDGATHFRESAVGMTAGVYVPGIPLVDSAAPLPVTMLTFSRLEPGYTSDWHPAPRRQFVLLLSGVIEVTVSDGETRSFGPGSVVLVEDTVGAGHQTRALGSDECLFVTVAC